MSVIYLLLETGAMSADDLGYLFAIEFIFAAVLIAIWLAKQEIDICCPGRTSDESYQIHSPLIL